MRNSVSTLVFVSCLFAGAVGMTAQQAPAAPPAGAAGQGPAAGGRGPAPAPANLKVLPKNWTNRQVGNLMQTFAESLGVTCAHCHAEDPNAAPPAPGQQPRLKYDLDDKPEKDVARKMIQMTMSLNSGTLQEVGDKTIPEKVSCFTCHRGEKTPTNAPAAGWRRGGFSLLPDGPTVAPRGGGPGPAAPPAAPPAN